MLNMHDHILSFERVRYHDEISYLLSYFAKGDQLLEFKVHGVSGVGGGAYAQLLMGLCPAIIFSDPMRDFFHEN